MSKIYNDKLLDYLTDLFEGNEDRYNELLDALRVPCSLVKETNEYRPLADYIVSLLTAARLEGAQQAQEMAAKLCEDTWSFRVDCHLCAREIRGMSLSSLE